MQKVFKKSIVWSVLSLGMLNTAYAQSFPTGKLFDLTVGVGSSYQNATDTVAGGAVSSLAGFSTVSDMFDAAKLNGLSNINKLYTDTSASVVRMGYRGLPIVISTSTTSAVNFTIPSLNFSKTFNAQLTRDGNVNDLREFLKSSSTSILDQMQQVLAKVSPVDPLAGNPNSLQSQMVMADFDRGFTQHASSLKDAGVQTNNLVGIGLSFGSYNQRGLDSDAVTLPLSYTFRSGENPARQLTVYAPITVSSVGNAKSYAVNLGVSYRYPLSENWALSPSIGYGVSGSADLGSAAAMMSMALTSQYVIHRDGYDIGIGNSLGSYQSQKFSAGDYSFNPGINNTVFRNGVMVSVPTTIWGKRMAYEFSFINTQFSGSELYSQNYNEIGLTLGTYKSASSLSNLRVGVTYLQGDNDINGLKLNVGYWF